MPEKTIVNSFSTFVMPGFQISDVDREKIDEKFLCSNCDLLLVEPMQTLCGHLMCKSCVERLKSSDNPACPKDGTLINESNVFPDRFTERELVALKLHCLNSECDWFGSRSDLQNHVNTCNYAIIKCVHTKCTTEVKRLLLAEHLKDECLYRSVRCENCHETLPYASMEQHIEESCQAVLLTCEYCKSTNIPRKEMTKHHTEECEEIEVECDFKSIGCHYNEASKRKELRKHYKDASRFHIQLLLRFIFLLQGEIEKLIPKFESFASKQMVLEEVNKIKEAISGEIRTMERKFSTMMATVTSLTERLKSFDLNKASGSNGPGANAEIRRVEIKMSKEIEKLEARNNRLEIQLREKTELLERCQDKMEQIDQSVALITAKFEDFQPLRGPEQIKVNYSGVLLWKIEGFQRKRQDALNGTRTVLYSPHFYTSEFGYKMCAKIYMNGDGFGKGTHMSLFFVVMKGDYDALQTWPMQKKITMMLLDQGNGDHLIDAFHSDPQSSSFQRPKSDMNIASGSPLFIPIASLNNRQYIKDDVMFIKVIVD